MTDDRDRPPDPAALDELSRAFADDFQIVQQTPDEPYEPTEPTATTEADEPDDAPGDGPDDAPDAPDDPDDADDADAEPADDSSDRFAEVADAPESVADAPESVADAPESVADDSVAAEAPPIRTIRIGADDLADLPPIPTTDPAGRSGDHGSPHDAVIAIDDDELPDAVYVEGSLDQDGSRSIVFIEDDDTGDTLKPGEDRDVRRGIEPRLRERRIAVRRAQSRKRLTKVGIVALVVVIVVGALALLGSGMFAIQADQVSITGAVYTDADRLQAVVDELVGTPTLLADTEGAERELESIPWVESASVRTDFPHAATIDIREREPMTTYQGPDQRFRVLDREGRVLDVIDGYPLAYLLLSGPDPVDLEPGEFAPRGYAAASELTKNLTPSIRGRIERIEVTADGSSLVMRLDDGTEVRFGEARDLFAKLVRLETVLTSGEEREPGVIDVSTAEVTM